MAKFKAKPHEIEAIRLTHQQQVKTRRGIEVVGAGWYLVTYPNGRKDVLSRGTFEAFYEPVKEVKKAPAPKPKPAATAATPVP